jgi:hypothetical protein
MGNGFCLSDVAIKLSPKVLTTLKCKNSDSYNIHR